MRPGPRPDSGPDSGPAETPATRSAIAAVHATVPPNQDELQRLARVTAAAAAQMRTLTGGDVRVRVRRADTSTVIEDGHRLSTEGIVRRLNGKAADGDADLDVVDGAGTGATTLAGPGPVVTIGAPTRRVVPVEVDGDEVIAVRTVVEVWAAGGDVLDVFATARLAQAVARAVSGGSS